MNNTSLEHTENKNFQVTKQYLPYLEKIPASRTAKILTSCYPRRRIPILKIQKAFVHESSKRYHGLQGFSVHWATHADSELRRIQRVELTNDFLEPRLSLVAQDQSSQIIANRLNSAKSLKSSRQKSAASQRYFVSPKPPKTQPSIPRYDSQPDLKMDLQDDRRRRTNSPETTFPIEVADRGCQTANPDIKVSEDILDQGSFGDITSRKTKSAAVTRRGNSFLLMRLQSKKGKVPEDYTIGSYHKNKKFLERDFESLGGCPNDVIDQWTNLEAEKTSIEEKRFQERVAGKKNSVRETKKRFEKVKVPPLYPHLTEAAVMLSAGPHAMDAYLKKFKLRQS